MKTLSFTSSPLISLCLCGSIVYRMKSSAAAGERVLSQLAFVLEGESDERVRALKAELGADVRAVVVDGAGARAERRGYLFGRLEFRQHQEDAPLGRGQIV